MHDNVDISRELQEVRLLFDSVLLTQGRSGGGGGNSDDALGEIAADILTKVSLPLSDVNLTRGIPQIIVLNMVILYNFFHFLNPPVFIIIQSFFCFKL